MTRMLHVANGTCTTRLIEAAGITGARSIWADPLYEGPVPAGLTDAELVEVRRTYLSGGADDGESDPVNDLRQWRAVIERETEYDELVLWFEHDLFDQLNLVQLLSWIHDSLPATKLVTLVCVDSFPGRPAFKGLGELTPGEVASLFPTRQPVNEAQYALAQRAWGAFRDASPEALDDLRRGETSALPYLATALTRFLQEYPWTSDGLSRTERRLLRLADAGPIDLRSAFPRMSEGEGAYYVTDLTLDAMADALAGSSPSLLTRAGRSRAERDVLEGAVSLTDAGRHVLAGEQDRVALCGFDRWLGGVHLQTDSNVWRWDDERGRIVKA